MSEFFIAFNVFKYITFRAAMASMTAFALSIILGPYVVKKLESLKLRHSSRVEGCPGLQELHRSKAEIPTMGGILIVSAICISTLLWSRLDNTFCVLVVFSILYLGAVGLLDDYGKIVRKGGLSGKWKLFFQSILGAAIGAHAIVSPSGDVLDVPFLKFAFPVVKLGLFYVLFSLFVVVGSSNAVNLTDGLDGLAVGCMVMVALTYAAFSYITGNIKFSGYLLLPYVPGTGELTVFCGAIAGSCLGFLWYNCFPAQVFMGDTGSLALGGAIGVVSIFVKKELVLVIAGGVFVAEALSVMLQTASYKLRGKRIFRVAPFHHHFQVNGIPEPKITVRLWIIGGMLALFALATLKLR